MRDPNKNVTFVFYCYEKESADLKVRLKYDGLTQGEFFRTLLRMYVANEPEMTPVVNKIKEKHKTMGKEKRKRSSASIAAGHNLLKELALTEDEKERIFDIIEVDTSEYE